MASTVACSTRDSTITPVSATHMPSSPTHTYMQISILHVLPLFLLFLFPGWPLNLLEPWKSSQVHNLTVLRNALLPVRDFSRLFRTSLAGSFAHSGSMWELMPMGLTLNNSRIHEFVDKLFSIIPSNKRILNEGSMDSPRVIPVFCNLSHSGRQFNNLYLLSPSFLPLHLYFCSLELNIIPLPQSSDFLKKIKLQVCT